MVSSMTKTSFIVPLLLAVSSPAAAQVPIAAAPVAAAPSVYQINSALGLWRQFRSGGNYSFNDYARLLVYYPGWPGESGLRAKAEKAMRPGENPALVIAFFATQKPTSGNGYARLADAYAATGRSAEALAAAREAWASSDLPAADEASIYARFGRSFTAADHDRRVDALLFDKDAADAQRFLQMTSPARQAAFTARVAMQLRWPDAEARYQAVARQLDNDAGLLMDRARYFRDAGAESSARQIAARPHNFTYRPADTDRYLEMMLLLAEGASDDREWNNAFNIARQVDDIFAPGTDLATQPYGVRDKYTSLTWLAGTVAYGQLRKPASAVPMFVRYSRGGKSALVETKGLYWAGRAAIAAGQLADSGAYFQRAAAYPELFYGQLSLERLGRGIPAPNPLPTFAVTPAQRAAFHSRPIVIATRLLGQQGQYQDEALFVRALAEGLDNDAERTLAVEFGHQIGRQDIPVWVARAARNNGQAFYVQDAYPRHRSGSPAGEMWSLTHGITRQESSFDRTAVSYAGARGMMQLMPGTAREQAGKMGLGYDVGRLTSDPNYNVMLGSAYFQRLLNRWNGSVPLAVASYNAGAGNVSKWIDRYGDPRRPGADVIQWIESIPFTETRGYVQRVIENSVIYDQLNPTPQHRSAVHVSRYLGKNRPA
jgi:soluble lytic murein transglycosylase